VSSAPDVIVVNTPPGLSALRVETHTIPIVFVQVLDASESYRRVEPGSSGIQCNWGSRIFMNTPIAANGWRCSRRSLLPCRALRSCRIQTIRAGSAIRARSRKTGTPSGRAADSERTYIRRPTSIMSSMLWRANLTAVCLSFRTHSPRFIATKSGFGPTIHRLPAVYRAVLCH